MWRLSRRCVPAAPENICWSFGLKDAAPTKPSLYASCTLILHFSLNYLIYSTMQRLQKIASFLGKNICNLWAKIYAIFGGNRYDFRAKPRRCILAEGTAGTHVPTKPSLYSSCTLILHSSFFTSPPPQLLNLCFFNHI